MTTHILLVDDEELILNVTDRMLRRFGYHVESQNSAQEAVELFQSKPEGFDMGITDMTMPQRTGVQFAAKLLEEGIYVIGFFFPVVPRGEARIRVQISAAHEKEHLDRAIEAFTKVGRDLGVLKN